MPRQQPAATSRARTSRCGRRSSPTQRNPKESYVSSSSSSYNPCDGTPEVFAWPCRDQAVQATKPPRTGFSNPVPRPTGRTSPRDLRKTGTLRSPNRKRSGRPPRALAAAQKARSPRRDDQLRRRSPQRRGPCRRRPPGQLPKGKYELFELFELFELITVDDEQSERADNVSVIERVGEKMPSRGNISEIDSWGGMTSLEGYVMH